MPKKKLEQNIAKKQEILMRFGALIPSKREELCAHCRFGRETQGQVCEFFLLPVTSQGNDCPYFKEGERSESPPSDFNVIFH